MSSPKFELKKQQKEEPDAEKRLQDAVNSENKKNKSHSFRNNPIIKFKKKKEDVSKEIPMSEKEVDDEYTIILKEWGAGDSLIKDELIKPLLHKYNNIVACRKRKEDEAKQQKEEQAQTIIDLFREKREISVLRKMLEKLRTAPILWVEEFIKCGGIRLILETLDSTKEDNQVQEACLNCIKAILNTKDGMAAFLEEIDAVKSLALVLDTQSHETKTEVLFLLAIVCSYDFRLVLDALDHYQLVKREEFRFQHLVNSLGDMSTNELDLELKAHILMLINALLNSAAESDDMMYAVLRKEFDNLGLPKCVEKLKEISNIHHLNVQINLYNDVSEAKKVPEDIPKYVESILKQKEQLTTLTSKVIDFESQILVLKKKLETATTKDQLEKIIEEHNKVLLPSTTNICLVLVLLVCFYVYKFLYKN